ncbi:hypothetical protein M8C11_21080 [Micromonospora sp. CPM1]|uniref:DUF4760 domain-containing protein n=1 Tax=Micromonospora sp. CPM1 TaxID=2944809 RepID=UPI00207D0D52|nr:hypothetical protein [Micromonospora sp. CPM1]MCO1617210.1 hypothetical protein [Micromonospora sp. CPM1]
MDTSTALNVAAFIASLIALCLSSAIALQQIRISRHANQLPVAVEFLWKVRTAEFLRREENLWTELPKQDKDLPFLDLPEPVRDDAQEVATFYQTVSYLVALGIVDERLAILPLHYRAPKTWSAIQQFVMNERARRDDPLSFLNAFEHLVDTISSSNASTLSGELFRRRR